jgi:hypothetical protein
MRSRELGVGNDTVRLSSLSIKCWPGVESVDVLAAFLVCSECWRECVKGRPVPLWVEENLHKYLGPYHNNRHYRRDL